MLRRFPHYFMHKISIQLNQLVSQQRTSLSLSFHSYLQVLFLDCTFLHEMPHWTNVQIHFDNYTHVSRLAIQTNSDVKTTQVGSALCILEFQRTLSYFQMSKLVFYICNFDSQACITCSPAILTSKLVFQASKNEILEIFLTLKLDVQFVGIFDVQSDAGVFDMHQSSF